MSSLSPSSTEASVVRGARGVSDASGCGIPRNSASTPSLAAYTCAHSRPNLCHLQGAHREERGSWADMVIKFTLLPRQESSGYTAGSILTWALLGDGRLKTRLIKSPKCRLTHTAGTDYTGSKLWTENTSL